MMHYTNSCQIGQFEAGLCGCFADCGSCCYAWCCYPCALSQAWADARGDSCSCCHIHAYEIFVKANIRQARGMKPNFCHDWCTNAFCPFCSLVQDMREISYIRAESKLKEHSSSNIVINYTNSSDNFNNQPPPQHPYGVPPSINNQMLLTDPNSNPNSSPSPYVPPVYSPPNQPYPSAPYGPPQPYQLPQFPDNSKINGNTPSDQS